MRFRGMRCIERGPGVANVYGPTIMHNHFYGTGGAAVSIENAEHPQIMMNSFKANMREFPFYCVGGGQINIGETASKALVYNNTLDGAYSESVIAGGSVGLEIHGSNHTIQLNTVTNHKGAAIGLSSVTCAQLVSNTVVNNGGEDEYKEFAVVKVGGPVSVSSDIHLDSNSVHDNYYPVASVAGTRVQPPAFCFDPNPPPPPDYIHHATETVAGFLAYAQQFGVQRIDYSANTGNSSYFYNNSGGSVYSGSDNVPSQTWNPQNCSLPLQSPMLMPVHTGIFRSNGTWILDVNGDGLINYSSLGVDRVFQYTATTGDVQVFGDWNGDGRTKTGVFRNGLWILDANGNGVLDNVNQPGGDLVFQYTGTAGDIPVVGDWNGDGRTKTGIFRTSGSSNGLWILDVNGDGVVNYSSLGVDMVFQYTGTVGDMPVVGRW